MKVEWWGSYCIGWFMSKCKIHESELRILWFPLFILELRNQKDFNIKYI